MGNCRVNQNGECMLLPQRLGFSKGLGLWVRLFISYVDIFKISLARHGRVVFVCKAVCVQPHNHHKQPSDPLSMTDNSPTRLLTRQQPIHHYSPTFFFFALPPPTLTPFSF